MSTTLPGISASDFKLPESLGPRLSAALMSGRPVAIAYTDEAGKPHISFRGTVQRFSDTQLAFWHREPRSGVAKAIVTNPHMALLYGDILDPATRAILTFTGRARVDDSEEVRRRVYEGSPEPERERDPEFKGVAVIIDLDEVSGLYEGQYVSLQRRPV